MSRESCQSRHFSLEIKVAPSWTKPDVWYVVSLTSQLTVVEMLSRYIVEMKLRSVLPWWFVPVILTEASVAERVVLPASRRRGVAALLLLLLLGTTPFMWVEGDTSCLVAVCPCRRSDGTE